MLHFLAGLPRSGSTVLAAILNQHPLVHVSTTSGLHSLIASTREQIETDPVFQTSTVEQRDKEYVSICRGIINGKYEHVTKPIILDKGRTWPIPRVMKNMEKILGRKMKIVATVRNVPDCIASFVKIAKPENLQSFCVNSPLVGHVQQSYISLHLGFQEDPSCFHFVDYDKLLSDPKTQLKHICEFLELPSYDFDFKNIDASTVKEDDEKAWNIPGLHDVKPVLERQSKLTAKDVLGDNYKRFIQARFWFNENEKDLEKPELDISTETAIKGDLVTAKKMVERLHKENPKCDRTAYNMGLFTLMDGKLQEGMAFLDRGRRENVFGNRDIPTPSPMWDGAATGTVLLVLEGGLGDQMHGVRYAKNIADRGCRVVVSCSPELFEIIQEVEGVSAVVCTGTSTCIYHDYWTPSMSVVRPLRYEYKDIKGIPYIPPSRHFNKSNQLTIGLRWQGNPAFEHEQHRIFPPKEFFDAVKIEGVRYISLQRDMGVEHKPGWVEQARLDTWVETKQSIASCDLVISSCTSVAHLAAATGKETWIVTPVLPYYLWALPGDKTPHYDSVTLFRQTKFDYWKDTMKQINKALKAKVKAFNKQKKTIK